MSPGSSPPPVHRRPRRSHARLRRGTVDDLDLLLEHRHRMFQDMGGRTEKDIREHDVRYRRWVVPRMRQRKLIAVVAISPEGAAVASGCMWFRETHPVPASQDRECPYILSVYTEPEHRGTGLATAIVRSLKEIARKRGYTQVRLNASDAGMGVYSRIGFERTTEMRCYLTAKLRKRNKAAHALL